MKRAQYDTDEDRQRKVEQASLLRTLPKPEVYPPEIHLMAYRIATYQPKERAAWVAALDELGLDPEQRAQVAALLNHSWRARQ